MKTLTYAQILQALPHKIRDKAISNLKKEHGSNYLKVECLANDPLATAFDWENSKEGKDYWRDVHFDYGKTLMRIVK